MPCRLPALKGAITRQTRLGNLMILFLGLWFILPYAMDKYRNEPSISTSLKYFSENEVSYIEDAISIKFHNRGSRNNYLIDEKDRIICAKDTISFWNLSKKTVWNMDAFVGCSAPLVPFKVCSVFSIYSKSGIERKFGADNEFCTPMIYPKVNRTT